MKILAIDTSLGAVAACLYDTQAGAVLAHESIAMERGHAEALMPLLDRLMKLGKGGFAAIERIAVTVGPGSFTGIRVGVAAARAIALARRTPVVGVSTLAAFAAPVMAERGLDMVMASVDARHGNVFTQTYWPNGRASAATVMPIGDAVRALPPGPVKLVGSGAPLVAIEAWTQGRQAEAVGDALAPPIDFVARLGALADPATALPRPLYLKAPDVKIPASPALPRAAPAADLF